MRELLLRADEACLDAVITAADRGDVATALSWLELRSPLKAEHCGPTSPELVLEATASDIRALSLPLHRLAEYEYEMTRSEALAIAVSSTIQLINLTSEK